MIMAIENLPFLKIKLSILWIITAFVWSTSGVLAVFDPAMNQQIIAGQTEFANPAYLTGEASLMLVLVVMAFLSLTLKDYVNRWTNIFLGSVYIIFGLAGSVEVMMNPSAWEAIYTAAMIVVPAVIVWYAYRWPKEVVQPVKAPGQKGEITV